MWLKITLLDWCNVLANELPAFGELRLYLGKAVPSREHPPFLEPLRVGDFKNGMGKKNKKTKKNLQNLKMKQ